MISSARAYSGHVDPLTGQLHDGKFAVAIVASEPVMFYPGQLAYAVKCGLDKTFNFCQMFCFEGLASKSCLLLKGMPHPGGIVLPERVTHTNTQRKLLERQVRLRHG